MARPENIGSIQIENKKSENKKMKKCNALHVKYMQ
jgi:hypothetical protein